MKWLKFDLAMRTINTFFILILFFCSTVNAQDKKYDKTKPLSESIYFSSFEDASAAFFDEFRRYLGAFNFKFLRFNEARLEANLTNTLYLDSFTTKPTKYYLDTYKKLYNLKGQRQTFLKIEKLYEARPKPGDPNFNY